MTAGDNQDQKHENKKKAEKEVNLNHQLARSISGPFGCAEFLLASTLLLASAWALAADLLATAENNPEVSIFVDAVRGTPLADTLSKQGPYTLFAPSNAAFNRLPSSTRNALLSDPAGLADVLAFHVIKGTTLIARITPGEAPTLQGSPVRLESDNGLVKVNGANVIESDLVADNGVIHVIDAILQPQRPQP